MDYTSESALNGLNDHLGRVFCPPDAAIEQFVVPVQLHTDGIHLRCLRLSTVKVMGELSSRADTERKNKLYMQYKPVDALRFRRILHHLDPNSNPYNESRSIYILDTQDSMLMKPEQLKAFPEKHSMMELSDELVVALGMKGNCSPEHRVLWN